MLAESKVRLASALVAVELVSWSCLRTLLLVRHEVLPAALDISTCCRLNSCLFSSSCGAPAVVPLGRQQAAAGTSSVVGGRFRQVRRCNVVCSHNA